MPISLLNKNIPQKHEFLLASASGLVETFLAQPAAEEASKMPEEAWGFFVGVGVYGNWSSR